MVARKTLNLRAIYERFHNMIVYPDNNIIIDHEKQIKALPISESIKYVYSYVHLNELKEAKNNLSSLKDSHLATIAELTNNRYVINHHHQLTISEISPAYLYDILEKANCIYKSSDIKQKLSLIKNSQKGLSCINELNLPL